MGINKNALNHKGDNNEFKKIKPDVFVNIEPPEKRDFSLGGFDRGPEVGGRGGWYSPRLRGVASQGP
jgi:hypothetical protein